MSAYAIGYASGEIEPKIAPLVDAVRSSGLITFSSCEGHVDGQALPRFASVAFYAHEPEARGVHEHFLRYRDRLACSWCLRGGFVLHRISNEFELGWTLENCGIINDGDSDTFVARTVEAGWTNDIPVLIEMFRGLRADTERAL